LHRLNGNAPTAFEEIATSHHCIYIRLRLLESDARLETTNYVYPPVRWIERFGLEDKWYSHRRAPIPQTWSKHAYHS
jgi:hypothetical protein